jgi:vancomycin resistance protein YoaR
VQNIGTAAKYIDGTLLLPGQTFSMNDTIKERTAENGYTKGFVIGEGGIFKMERAAGSPPRPPRCSTPPGSPGSS